MSNLPQAAAIESVLVQGDLSKLSAEQRTSYYMSVCKSLGLNPLTRPLDFITLNGKLVLYAKKDATDQIRAIKKISITKLETLQDADTYQVTAYAENSEGRKDSDIGITVITNLKGDALINAKLKATTKAKRRVTLSLGGLGLLDETELETIPSQAKAAPVQIHNETIKPQARVEVMAPEAQPKHLEGAVSVEQDPGVYMVTFGKFKGSRLNEIDPQDIAGYMAFLEKSAAAKGEGLKNHAQEFVDRGSVYLETFAHEVKPPSTDQGDFPF